MLVLNKEQNPLQKIPAESTLRQNLTAEFKEPDYRYAYAESFLNTKLASQIKIIRQQRTMTQAQVADLMGIKQSGYARFEDVNHSVWKTDTLWKIARALGVRVNISLEGFNSLIHEKERFDRQHLERPTFEEETSAQERKKGASNWASDSDDAAIRRYIEPAGVDWEAVGSISPEDISAVLWGQQSVPIEPPVDTSSWILRTVKKPIDRETLATVHEIDPDSLKITTSGVATGSGFILIKGGKKQGEKNTKGKDSRRRA